MGAEAVEIDSRQCRQQWTGLASTGDKLVLEALLWQYGQSWDQRGSSQTVCTAQAQPIHAS